MLKIFYWNAVESLESYSRGQVIALAETYEDAVELAKEHLLNDDRWLASGDPCDLSYRLKKLEAELSSSEPRVFDSPTVIPLWGSDSLWGSD